MKVLRWITAGVLIVCSVLSFTLIRGVLSVDGQEKIPAKYKGILTIWQIDSFEGGTGSRKQFLLKVAREYERKNQGVLVMVISHTVTSFENAVKQGQTPDIISFGGGVDVKNATRLNCKKTVIGGYVGDRIYATAWAMGSYFIIANPTLSETIPDSLPSLLVSQQEYTQPMLSLYFENVKVGEMQVQKPMEAYVKFTNGKTPYFLATQRDVHRLINRGMPIIAKPLNKFNDLYQYVVVTAKSNEKIIASENFIEHLLSEKVQRSLVDIGMLSPYYKLSYDNELNQVQTNNDSCSISAFISPEQLKSLQELSKSALAGDKDSQNKIKNMVIKS